MPKRKKVTAVKAPSVTVYPSIVQMVAETHPPKRAVRFLADCVQALQKTVVDLERRVRRAELRAALQAEDERPAPKKPLKKAKKK